jgi:MFS family permease
MMIVGGLIGAVVVPMLSDRYRKRTPFIGLALAGAVVGLVGITFATSYGLLLASAFILGLFLLSAGPVGFQYGAEVTYPAPEGASNGLLILMGQISGILFIFGMDIFKSKVTGSMTSSLVVLIVFIFLGLFLCTRLKESVLITENGNR